MIFNGAFLLIVFVLTIYGVFHGEDLGAMMDAIRSADKRWLVPGLALVAFFIWGESIIIWYMMRSYGIKLKKRNLFSLFIGRILFQLYYTICEWWTANAGILYEKEKYIYPGFCGYSDDHYDHL
nr:lysylphosphatidylglycerol synthase domain-containing protein [Blautia obeum]